MSYIFKQIWSNGSNYTKSNRDKKEIDTIVVHYTGNNGDTAENNGNYFKNNAVGVSSHYFVDDTTVVRSVGDCNIAWHAGDWGINCRSIGVEIAGSTTECTGRTLANVILLVQRLMLKYDISVDRVIRHYDCNGKLCPAFWCGSKAKDALFKKQFLDKLSSPSNVKESKPTLTYRAFTTCDYWTPEVKGLAGSVGVEGKSICCVAVKVSKGSIKYRVHALNSGWLPWVTGYDINDYVNGYAGNKFDCIDMLQVVFEGGTPYKATYRVKTYNDNYFLPWQYNTEVTKTQDGYAGIEGVPIECLQITLT